MNRRLVICRKSSYVAVSILVGLVALMAAPGYAQLYEFVDQSGVLHFTNVPTTAAYRKVHLPPAGRPLEPAGQHRPRRPGALLRTTEAVSRGSSYDRHIREACRRYGMNYRLIKAVIRAESAFDPLAVSAKGAEGLMQLMPETSRDLGVNNPFDPTQNIDGGVRYLKMLLERFDNNIILALAAYNAGPEAVQKYGGIPPYAETKTYIRRVLDLFAFGYQ